MGTEPRGPKFTIDYNCFFDFFKSFPWERVMKIQLQYIYIYIYICSMNHHCTMAIHFTNEGARVAQ
jgi:hypothetical protein